MPLRDVSLDDKYSAESGEVLLTGTQALVRLLLMQSSRDRAQGVNSAGYVTGYRGSPLGGLDIQLERARLRLEAAQVRFQPGLNEDLAATAVWGTQQAHLLPQARFDGVYAMWYGKGPGVDRSGDPIKHGNRMGTAPHGGVLLVFGDDHAGKSSTVAHQSEMALAANGVPVLYPATVQEYIDFGLLGWALSRFSGLWVAMKCVNETAEATATVLVSPDRPRFNTPADFTPPPGGLHARLQFDPLGDDVRLMRHKLPAVRAFSRVNDLDRIVSRPRFARMGIMATGKGYLDTLQALKVLGLDATRCAELGLALYKPGLIWPLDAQRLAEFAADLTELLVIEEKTSFVEQQAAHALFNLPAHRRPFLIGKTDEHGRALLPSDVQLDAALLARAIGERLTGRGMADSPLRERLSLLQGRLAEARARSTSKVLRTPYFCSGCPHNTSTRLPDGSIALAGIGCHTMALGMERRTLPPTQMGGEGATWSGIAPFSGLQHVFQNLGDGTYTHSGLLAIRAAVQSGVNITYKLLVNDAVAMTGGQAVEGGYSVAEITRQLAAERVSRIAVITDNPKRHRRRRDFARGVTVHHRDELMALQRAFRELPGVTVMIYEQTCAAEKRRRRKRGTQAEPERRVFIHPTVCEGCGDCSTQSNCVSIEPLETEFGRKRSIDQYSCNKDYTCTKGFCPSFVTVTGATVRRPAEHSVDEALLRAIPAPGRADLSSSYCVLITGIGGTGIVTIGALLAMAAHLEGLAASAFDMTGMAQKGGAVLSHVKFAREAHQIGSPKVGFAEADLILGCDPLVSASPEAVHAVECGRTTAVVNGHLTPTAAFQLDPDVDFEADAVAKVLESVIGKERCHFLDANAVARKLLGDAMAANMILVGYALQLGRLPVGLEAIVRTIELNGVSIASNKRALALGRLAAHAPGQIESLLAELDPAATESLSQSFEHIVAHRQRFLTDYQDEAYAARYRRLVDQVAAAESVAAPGSSQLTTAVARCYFKLLAYKDEYEVARLYTVPAFRQMLEQQFAGSYRVRLHLAPPFLFGREPSTGYPRKRTFGGWIIPLMRVLAGCRGLRGTLFDPFAYTQERREERRLIAEYEDTIAFLISNLSARSLEAAVKIAALPERIRGFGPVKQRHVKEVADQRSRLLAQFTATSAAVRPISLSETAQTNNAAAAQ